MEGILVYIICVLLISEVVLCSIVIIKEFKTDINKTKIYIIWLINILIALFFIIISTENSHTTLTGFAYAVLCIGGIMVILGGNFLCREYYSKKKKYVVLQVEEKEDIKTDELEKEYEKIIKYKEKLGYMRHDIVKHMSVLERKLDNDDERIKRLDDIKEQLQKVIKIKYCKNKMVDVVIEKKLTEIMTREIKIETDIRLMNLNENKLNEVCMIIWLLIENMAVWLHKEDKLYIKLNEKKTKNKDIYISYYIETDRNNISLRSLRRSNEMNLLKPLMDKADGSIILLKKDGKVIETGIFLGR